VGGDVPVDSETLLVTDFMDLKIKLTQSFKDGHRDMVYIYIFIKINNDTCINIYIYNVFLNKNHPITRR
jgi:hypothetical protein